MAAKKKNSIPKSQGSDKKDAGRILYSILTVLASILIVAVIFAGAFYYVLKNDINGLGEQLRPTLQNIPVLKYALPDLPETEDPEDPKYLTTKEIEEKYNELRALRDDLIKQLEDAQNKIEEYENDIETIENLNKEYETKKLENEQLLQEIQEEQEELLQDKKVISDLIASGDTDGFKQYFEKIDSATASELYKEIIKEDAVSEGIQDLAKTYEEMDSGDAATVFETLADTDLELVLDLITEMKRDASAEILSNMDPEISAEITKTLADRINNQFN